MPIIILRGTNQRQGVICAYENVDDDKYTKTEAKEYLKTFGINDNTLLKKIFNALLEGIDITNVLPAKWKHHTDPLMLNHISNNASDIIWCGKQYN